MFPRATRALTFDPSAVEGPATPGGRGGALVVVVAGRLGAGRAGALVVEEEAVALVEDEGVSLEVSEGGGPMVGRGRRQER